MEEFKNEIFDTKFKFLELMQEFPKENHCYTLLKQPKLKLEENCSIMAFNFDDTILASACDDKIVFFNFTDKKLIYDNQVEITGRVIYLKFISQISNQLLSIIEDDSIYIWEQNYKKEFIIIQQIEMIPFDVTSIDYSSKYIAFGSSTGNVDIYSLMMDWTYPQIFTDLGYIQSVSLNQECNKLISGGKEKEITIFQICKNKWIICQKINVQSEVLRLKFFGNQFLIYEPQINQLSIYTLKRDKFERENERKLSGNGREIQNYPIFQSQNGFVIKHSNFLSFINYSTFNKRCELNLQIYFENENFLGCLTNNEEYLIIWNETTKEYEIRQWTRLID